MNKKQNVMITGCAGFIGSHAVDYFLNKGYHVIGIDCFTYAGKVENIRHQYANPNFKLYNLDICNAQDILKICKARKIDWIINFAAETHVDNSIKNSTNFIHSNINGVHSLLEVCHQSKTMLFHVSTDEVYGSISEGEFNENDKLTPQNPYSATKAAAEHLIRSYTNTHGIKHLMVRPSNNFGPRQHNEKFLPTIFRNLKLEKLIPIYGDGSNIRDWLFVKDTAAAIEFLVRKGKINETYNITAKNEMKNLDLLKLVCQIKDIKLENYLSFVKDRPGHDFRYSICNKKLMLLGFNGFSDFRQSLSETISYSR